MKEALSVGKLVISSMGKGHFTDGGHYILLVGINNGMIDVYDPNNDKVFEMQLLRHQQKRRESEG
ncbi:hypothetical protein [Paenibacillus macquariensis]|uniref:hypothetical protein n=1 Tax=Paenibacillus macquariensis TaxID=948756 RepID=UPI0007C37F7F|nr:hypothetical protein [Paenibacillus macquariensis]MEC0092679.1 hypothetical protein [Paenibacillus macquariensis]OAB36615.1 hypothetical protein PMSM_06330 [Paenibacillus macquariensis subsp. macquariensis]